MTGRTRFLLIAVLILIVALGAFMVACGDKGEGLPPLVTKSDIAHLEEIQALDNLSFEWLRPYSPLRPTMILIHGETTGAGDKKFTMDLDANEYTFKKDAADTDYVVADKIGYRAEGLRLDISNYWLSVSSFNVAVFHWEKFADEANPDDTVAKIFTTPKMRYSLGEDRYETTAVPNNSLTEIFAALYLDEMNGKFNGNEIRFIGSGVGADLALSATHYLATYVKDGKVEKNLLPARLTLCDPYFSNTDMNFANDKIAWADISSKGGMLGVADAMLTDIADYGAAIEMVESKEIGTATVPDGEGGTVTQNTASYAYDIAYGEKDEVTMGSIKTKLTYLELRESYSSKFSDNYKAFKRIALDWYLYSIIGSDDSGNAGASYAAGYPRSIADYYTTTSTGFNWAENETRPMVNNRYLNNDGSGYTSRGKNYSLSAWTPTHYIRALRGISFEMKKYLSTTTNKTAHGNPIYNYNNYTLAQFRSENFQVSDQTDYTLVCGYVYSDNNGDKRMNEGYNGLEGVKVLATITTGSGDTLKTVAEFSTKTDKNGYYVFRLPDKTIDSEGKWSDSGYAFDVSHTMNIEVGSPSRDYLQLNSAASGKFYTTLGMHNFNGLTTSLALNNYTGGTVNVLNCLVVPV